MANASTTFEVNAPIEKVYQAISDFKCYPEFVSGTKKVTILEQEGSLLKVAFEVEAIKTIRYSLEVNLIPQKGFSWKLSKGDFMKSNEGSWELRKIDKQKTEAIYHIEVKFGFLVPASAGQLLVSKHLPKMLDEFKQRAESL